MLTKYILILLCCYVYSVVSVTTFIDKGQRAELFELIENEMPTVRVYMPDDEFIDFKEKAQYLPLNLNEFVMPKMKESLRKYLSTIQMINFYESFPENDFKKMFPQLQIDEDGYANFDIEDVVSGFDYDPSHYNNYKGEFKVFLNQFFKTNENFNLFEIIDTIKKINYEDVNDDIYIHSIFIIVDEYFEYLFTELSSPKYLNITSDMPIIKYKVKYYIQFFKLVNFTEVYPGNDFNNILPELQIGKDGYAKFDVEEVLSGFNFDTEYYKNFEIKEYKYLKEKVYESNDNFNLSSIRYTLSKLEMVVDKYELYERIDNILKTSGFFDDIISEISDIFDDTNSESSKIPLSMINDNVFLYEYFVKYFKTKNATMTFELNGIKKTFKKVTFSIGGNLSREFPKPHYNLKIKGGDELYGRSQFKLRSDFTEPTYLRTKLASDIHNLLGLKSLSAGYSQLYINDEFMGLYIITDSYHLSWVEKVYDDKKSVSLYECDRDDENDEYTCTNKNDEIPNEIKDETEAELNSFLEKIKNFKSSSEIEDIFEVEHFLYEMALEYLFFGWDHIIRGHNFFFYKQPNGKWIYLTQDFDHDFGQQDRDAFGYTIKDFLYRGGKIHLTDVLILNDPQRFNEILKDIVEKVFNPSTLYPHIDELKQYIKPFVQLDKTVDSNGNYPGAINRNKDKYYTLEQWDAYSEFTTGTLPFMDESEIRWENKYQYLSYGLKYYILMKYRDVCINYDMECDPIYMNENYTYSINKSVDYLYKYHREDYKNLLEISTNYPFKFPNEETTDILIETPTENLNEHFAPSKSSESESSDEEETEYEIDAATFITDDESSFDEEENTTE